MLYTGRKAGHALAKTRQMVHGKGKVKEVSRIRIVNQD